MSIENPPDIHILTHFFTPNRGPEPKSSTLGLDHSVCCRGSQEFLEPMTI